MDEKWPFPFPFFYRDIQKIFSYVYEDHKSRRSLRWAVEFMNIRQDQEFHDAFSDAVYTARILSRLPGDVVEAYTSIDTYRTPKNRKEEIFVNYGTYTKFISKCFDGRDDVMKDHKVILTCCPECGRKLRRKIRWFSENGKNYLCAAECPDHGMIKGKIRIRQNGDGKWFAVKTIRPITEAELAKVRERQETVRRRRREHRAKG